MCRGKCESVRASDIEKLRRAFRPIEPRDDGTLVSVVIPIYKTDEKYFEKTVESVLQNASGKIEIVYLLDEKEEGHRVLTNRMVQKATGRYILRLDCHCAMSPGWDLRMKRSCRKMTLIRPVVDVLDENKWTGRNNDMAMVVLSPRLENQFVSPWKSFLYRGIEEDTMSIIGCCYMARKEDFLAVGGCDESLGKWGGAGPEMALKFWMSGGKCLTRTDTVCYHLFRKETPFSVNSEELGNVFKKVYMMFRNGQWKTEQCAQVRQLSWLLDKFRQHLVVSSSKSHLNRETDHIERPVEVAV
jgi:cellulose synthase/poly-beta-1,6-N-acetylglucosamine synthase-like glycosyltransferase